MRPQIGAWGKIHVGWIPEDRTREIYANQQGAVLINPLENTTIGIQAITIYVTPTTYFLVENREQVGFDSVLPDKGILISYVDEGKYWRCNGPVVVQDANSGSGSRWQLLHPTFNTGPQSNSLYTNNTFNLAVDLVDRYPNGSYLVAVGKPDSIDMAKSAYLNLNVANAAIQNASTTGRTQGLDQAKDPLRTGLATFLRRRLPTITRSSGTEQIESGLYHHSVTNRASDFEYNRWTQSSDSSDHNRGHYSTHTSQTKRVTNNNLSKLNALDQSGYWRMALSCTRVTQHSRRGSCMKIRSLAMRE